MTWREEFDNKFPWRIYGRAGEPKTEFISTENMPDKIKDFIQSLLDKQRKEVVEGIIGDIPDWGNTDLSFEDRQWIQYRSLRKMSELKSQLREKWGKDN